MGKILVVGSINMDLVVRADRLPKPGETIIGDQFETIPGGKGANQAIAASRMGASVRMVGSVGNDPFGSTLSIGLANDGIDVTYLRHSTRMPNGVALIQVDKHGQNTIIVVPGANGELAETDLATAFDGYGSGDLLLLQLEIPMPTVLAAAKVAKKQNMTVLVNPAPAQRLSAELLNNVDILIPNESEAKLIGESDELELAVERIRKQFDGILLVTMGEEGVDVWLGAESERIPAFKVEAIDTVAAGDAFVGALAANLAEGISLRNAIRSANAAAAISVTRPGAQPSLPRKTEVATFLQQIGP